jgi:hypothetical protein
MKAKAEKTAILIFILVSPVIFLRPLPQIPQKPTRADLDANSITSHLFITDAALGGSEMERSSVGQMAAQA